MRARALPGGHDVTGPLVVLGAGGYLGTAVAARAEPLNRQVRLVRRPGGSLPVARAPGAGVVDCDVADPADLRRVVEGAGAVVHLASDLAGRDGWRGVGRASHGAEVMVNLIEACRRAERPVCVVLASTVGHQGVADGALSPYEEGKREEERLLLEATAAGRVDGVVLRLPTVYGCSPAAPSRPGRGVVATMVRRALSGEPLTVWAGGTVRRSFLHVEDAAQAFVASLSAAEALSGGRWDVAPDDTLELRDALATVAAVVAEVTGRAAVPVESVTPPAHALPADLEDVAVDAGPFRERSGWRPTRSFAEGVHDAVTTLAGDRPLQEGSRR
nr:NAD-dependent epimerase/dehydratase family protein [Nocardioides lijunqiniae]